MSAGGCGIWYKLPNGNKQTAFPKAELEASFRSLTTGKKKELEERKDAPNVGQRHAMVLIGRSTIKKYALSRKKKRIDEHLAIHEHCQWAGLDARTLGRADAFASAHLGAI